MAPPNTQVEGVEVTVQTAVRVPYYKSGECVLGDTGTDMCVSVCLHGVSRGCVAAPVTFAEGASEYTSSVCWVQ